MVKKMSEAKETIEKFIKILDIPKEQPFMLREYGEYIENFNSILSKNKSLENQKIEIENMQSQLKKL
jgi:hypothetical protein